MSLYFLGTNFSISALSVLGIPSLSQTLSLYRHQHSGLLPQFYFCRGDLPKIEWIRPRVYHYFPDFLYRLNFGLSV